MIKVDEILANNDRIIQRAVDDQKLIVRQMKKQFEEELERKEDKIARIEREFSESYNELKSKFEKA